MVSPSTRTPEGEPNRCPICGKGLVIEPSLSGDATCPHCGSLLWFPGDDALSGFPVFTLQREAAGSKEQAIRSVLQRMAEGGQVPRSECDSIARAILTRERLGSTGIGRGLAIPHAKHSAVERLTGALAKVPDGVDFESLDNQPVHTICLLVSPSSRPGNHLRALEDLSRRLRERLG